MRARTPAFIIITPASIISLLWGCALLSGCGLGRTKCTSSAECPPPPCDAHGCPLPTCSLDGGTLGGNATLHMNGHSISGGTVGVFCRSKCLVEGPGEIFGVESAVVFLRARAAVQNLNVHDTTFFGIGSPILGSLDLANVTLSNIGDNAIRAGRVSATNVTVTNSGNVYAPCTRTPGSAVRTSR